MALYKFIKIKLSNIFTNWYWIIFNFAFFGYIFISFLIKLLLILQHFLVYFLQNFFKLLFIFREFVHDLIVRFTTWFNWLRLEFIFKLTIICWFTRNWFWFLWFWYFNFFFLNFLYFNFLFFLSFSFCLLALIFIFIKKIIMCSLFNIIHNWKIWFSLSQFRAILIWVLFERRLIFFFIFHFSLHFLIVSILRFLFSSWQLNSSFTYLLIFVLLTPN